MCVGDGNGDAWQIARFANRGLPALLIEQLLDVRKIVAEHFRARGRNSRLRSVKRSVRLTLVRGGIMHAHLPQDCAVWRLFEAARLFCLRDPPLVGTRRTTSVASLLRAFLRARFQILRVEAASLRARLASRLASFNRFRARFSSSLAMRTRCLATSACSLARSMGSACDPSAGWVPRDELSLPVFFI